MRAGVRACCAVLALVEGGGEGSGRKGRGRIETTMYVEPYSELLGNGPNCRHEKHVGSCVSDGALKKATASR